MRWFFALFFLTLRLSPGAGKAKSTRGGDENPNALPTACKSAKCMNIVNLAV
jgi:hypothetical protein